MLMFYISTNVSSADVNKEKGIIFCLLIALNYVESKLFMSIWIFKCWKVTKFTQGNMDRKQTKYWVINKNVS